MGLLSFLQLKSIHTLNTCLTGALLYDSSCDKLAIKTHQQRDPQVIFERDTQALIDRTLHIFYNSRNQIIPLQCRIFDLLFVRYDPLNDNKMTLRVYRTCVLSSNMAENIAWLPYSYQDLDTAPYVFDWDSVNRQLFDRKL